MDFPRATLLARYVVQQYDMVNFSEIAGDFSRASLAQCVLGQDSPDPALP